MNAADIATARDDAMTKDEIKEQADKLATFYAFAIKTREAFDRAVVANDWDESAAEERLASLIFGDGSDGDDRGAIVG